MNYLKFKIRPTALFMPCVEELPLELWNEILDLVCVDGGTTDPSLCFVSHHINENTRYHLYDSIKIDTVEQTLKLEDQISKQKQDGYALLCLENSVTCIILPTLKDGPLAPEDDHPGGRRL